MYKLHTHCRACGYALNPNAPSTKSVESNEHLIPVFSLGHQPLANAFVKDDEPQSPHYPLKVLFCPRCTLAQLNAVVPPEVLYSNYKYVTSRSDMMLDHFHELWRELSKDGPVQSLVEIGSNDGFFMEFAGAHGAERMMGIDPAENLVKKCCDLGLPVTCDTFNAESARIASDAVPCPDVILARHVFCHVDDWRAFVSALCRLAGDDTRIAIEVPYVVNLLKNCEFDTIYHEHLSYLSLKAMEALLESSPFCITRVVDFNIHGGSILIVIKRRGRHKIEEDTAKRIDNETITLLDWDECSKRAYWMIKDLREFVLAHTGDSICGFGASAKSTVWVHAAGLDGHLRFICDSTSAKQLCRSPGTSIPIVDGGALLRELPKYAICFAWNFREEVLKRNARYQELGGHFVFPVPRLEVV